MLLFLYMNIIWKGGTFIQIITKSFLKDQIVVSIDPSLDTKNNFVNKADITLLTFSSQGNKNVLLKTGPVAEDGFLINEPGEYEIKEVYIKGIRSEGEQKNNVIYTIESEGMKVCHLSHIKQKELNSNQLEKIGEVDILTISIGNEELVGRSNITSLISQIEPKIIIPIGYSFTKSDDVPSKESQELKMFLKTIGQTEAAVQDKLSIKKKELLGEESKVIILNPKNVEISR